MTLSTLEGFAAAFGVSVASLLMASTPEHGRSASGDKRGAKTKKRKA